MVPKCPITLHEIILLNPCSWQILVVWWQRLCRKLNKCVCHCQNFQRLCVSSTVMERSTPLFVQLYTLHADGTVFPLSSLFGDSSERPPISTYPGILDDQPVARNLLKKKFPNTTIWGCFFHFIPCVLWRVPNCGLTTEFRENEIFHQLVRWAAVLLLVSSHRVEDVWFLALEDNEETTVAVTCFKDNVTETWIEAHFEYWNHFEHGVPWLNFHLALIGCNFL